MMMTVITTMTTIRTMAFQLMMNIVNCFEHLVLSVSCGLPSHCLLNPLRSPEDRKCTWIELID